MLVVGGYVAGDTLFERSEHMDSEGAPFQEGFWFCVQSCKGVRTNDLLDCTQVSAKKQEQLSQKDTCKETHGLSRSAQILNTHNANIRLTHSCFKTLIFVFLIDSVFEDTGL